jgi:hypothetical protein
LEDDLMKDKSVNLGSDSLERRCEECPEETLVVLIVNDKYTNFQIGGRLFDSDSEKTVDPFAGEAAVKTEKPDAMHIFLHNVQYRWEVVYITSGECMVANLVRCTPYNIEGGVLTPLEL